MEEGWESTATTWLSTLPTFPPTPTTIDAFLSSNPHPSLPPDAVHARILSLPLPRPTPNPPSKLPVPKYYQFQRSDLWIPVYDWLESLDSSVPVTAKEVAAWLAENGEVRERLLRKHTRYHLMHYIQKMHTKMLHKLGKLQMTAKLRTRRAPMKTLNNAVRTRPSAASRRYSGFVLKDKETPSFRKSEALLRYDLLTELEDQLKVIILKHKDVKLPEACPQTICSLENEVSTRIPSDSRGEESGTRFIAEGASNSLNVMHLDSKLPVDSSGSRKRMNEAGVVMPAWCHSDALPGSTFLCSSLSHEDASARCLGKEELQVSSSVDSALPLNKNIVSCLEGREIGISWPFACSRRGYAGRNREKWIPFLQGWKSLATQFEGHAASLQRRCYSSWIPSWCAYTSSVAIAQPFGGQGVQKVLDVRFHPEGLAQLVCSSNEPPNELLLYNLHSGRGVELTGHNCQIQAVEFAVRGASIVSCGGNIVKVWDSTTGSCLYTFGFDGDAQASSGHTKKINAMTVNPWQSCLVATCGGSGDGKLLLWNVLTGQLAADLNANLRSGSKILNSVESVEFCNQNLLACGTESSRASPALVQLWDIEAPQTCQSLSANDSYITSLKVSPDSKKIITGAGNGEVSLFDVRTCEGISHLSVGSNHEVTSVSFSSCGTYFHASSTSNSTLVWDTRLLSTSQTPVCVEGSVNNVRSLKPLHCLSHGKPMPTAEHAGQIPGHVDEGDQGVNDAHWLQKEPVLATVSGDGSLAMWDVTLGEPCIRHLTSHTRCANTVAVAPNDDYICSGGDDQKVVLYHNLRGSTHSKWRLTHPLSEVE